METGEKIRVVVVDDHAMVRSGLATFMDTYEDLELVGEAASGEAAVQVCEHVQPDVVLMDLKLPGMDGVAATRAILGSLPMVRVLAVTSYQEGDLVQEALSAGATGYLLKDVEPDELAKAIRGAHAGRPTLAPEATKKLIQVATGPAPLGHDLSDRERQVLGLMVEGISNREMAQRLDISYSTVKFHVSSILSKLDAESRTEAVSLALRNQLLD